MSMIHSPSNFINRNAEVNFVRNELKDKQRVALEICCDKASGFSSFCGKIGKLSSDSNIFSIYVDGLNQSGYSLYTSVFEKLLKSEKSLAYKVLGKQSIQEPGSVMRYLGSALSAVPFAGDFLGEPFKQVAENIKTIRHNGYLQEEIIKLILDRSSEQPMLFVIDNLAALDGWSKDLIYHLADTDASVNYILGNVKRNPFGKNDDLIDKLLSKEYYTNSYAFASPDIYFIEELFNYYNKKIDKSYAEYILEKTEGNIYKIIAALNGNNFEAEIDQISTIGKYIVKILALVEQPIRASDIITIISDLPDTSLYSESYVVEEVNKLFRLGYIYETKFADGDSLIKLKGTSISEILLEKESIANSLFILNKLYEFYLDAWDYGTRHSKTEIALLLFRLSEKVGSNKVKKHATDIIKLSFTLGTSHRAEEYISSVININKPINEAEYFSGVTFNIASRKYDRALDIIKNPLGIQWAKPTYYKIAECICLERSRHYKDFDYSFNQLLPATNIHEEGILRIHQINSLVHRNRIEEGKKIFSYCMQNLQKSSSYPYILRTATSLYNPEKSEEYINKSIDMFQIISDDFGYASTLANKGLLLIEMGKYPEALSTLETAKKILRVFGIHHLNIVENNIGLVYLKLGKYQTAIQHFEKSIALANGEMAKFYSNVNISIAEAMTGNYKSAHERLSDFLPFVNSYPVDRVRQKFFPNYTSVLMLNQHPKKAIKDGIAQIRRHLDRKYPQSSTYIATKIANEINQKRNDFRLDLSYFSPCYLEYWYSNPLSDLPLESLPN